MSQQIVEASLIAAIVVAVADLLVYVHLRAHPEHLTLPFLVLAILVTLVPIWINIWLYLEVSQMIMRANLIAGIVVIVTDSIEYWYLKKNPDQLSLRFIILVILVTVIPIWINIWFHLSQ
jgi:uncharacterized membrane protein